MSAVRAVHWLFPPWTPRLSGKVERASRTDEAECYVRFFYLRQLFGGAEKLRSFRDQDSGMRAACLTAFQPESAERRADAFYVRIARS